MLPSLSLSPCLTERTCVPVHLCVTQMMNPAMEEASAAQVLPKYKNVEEVRAIHTSLAPNICFPAAFFNDLNSRYEQDRMITIYENQLRLQHLLPHATRAHNFDRIDLCVTTARPRSKHHNDVPQPEKHVHARQKRVREPPPERKQQRQQREKRRAFNIATEILRQETPEGSDEEDEEEAEEEEEAVHMLGSDVAGHCDKEGNDEQGGGDDSEAENLPLKKRSSFRNTSTQRKKNESSSKVCKPAPTQEGSMPDEAGTWVMPWEAFIPDATREKCAIDIEQVPRCVLKAFATDVERLKRVGKNTLYKCVELPRRPAKPSNTKRKANVTPTSETYTAQVTTFIGGRNDTQLGTFVCQHVAAIGVAAAIKDARLRTRDSFRGWIAWLCAVPDAKAALSMWRKGVPTKAPQACTQRRCSMMTKGAYASGMPVPTDETTASTETTLQDDCVDDLLQELQVDEVVVQCAPSSDQLKDKEVVSEFEGAFRKKPKRKRVAARSHKPKDIIDDAKLLEAYLATDEEATKDMENIVNTIFAEEEESEPTKPKESPSFLSEACLLMGLGTLPIY